jgi:hypothetical protein
MVQRMTALRIPAILLAALSLQACTAVDGALTRARDSFTPAWGGPRPQMPSDSLTVQRIRGTGAMSVNEALRPEDGDVWPAPEGPRATLANPDEALRGIPAFRPGEGVSAPPMQSSAPPPRRRGSSSPPPDPLNPAPVPDFVAVPPPAQPAPRQRRRDGEVIPTPGGPAVTTGGTDRIQSVITPQGTGTAIRDGAATTIITPGGGTQVVPNPR